MGRGCQLIVTERNWIVIAVKTIMMMAMCYSGERAIAARNLRITALPCVPWGDRRGQERCDQY
jgi:hypothetical protein